MAGAGSLATGSTYFGQIHSGLIPVGKRESWLAAPSKQGVATVAVAATVDNNLDNRSMARTIFQSDIAEPWKAIINLAQFRRDSFSVNLENFSCSSDNLTFVTKNFDEDNCLTHVFQLIFVSYFLIKVLCIQ